MKHLGLLALIFSLVCLQTGCVTPARELEKTAVTGQLHAGQSQAEVRQILGPPKRTEEGSSGKKLDVYIFPFPKTGPATPGMRFLGVRSVHVLYDAQARVENFTWYEGLTRTFAPRYSQSWQLGRPLEMEKVDQIKRLVSSHDDLVRLFGPATIEGLDIYGHNVMSWSFMTGRQLDAAWTEGRELLVWLTKDRTVADYSVRGVQP